MGFLRHLFIFATMALPLKAGESVGLDLPPDAALVDQALHSHRACAPTALLNALKFGSASHRAAYGKLVGGDDATRLHHLVDRYFRRPSVAAPGGNRFTPKGVAYQDLFAAVQEVGADFNLPAVRSVVPAREIQETSAQMVQRVHGDWENSLQQGMAPLVSLHAQAAFYNEEKERWEWREMARHAVAVVRIPADLRPEQLGFGFECIDPEGGRLATGFVHAERWQSMTGSKNDNRYLQVKLPETGLLGKVPPEWHERAVILLVHYASAGW